MTAADELAPLPAGTTIRAGGLRFVYSRASGPGGQAVNKISSKATLRVALHDIGGLDFDALGRLRRLAGARLTHGDELLISAESSRSQLDNKRECVRRLAQLLQQAHRTPKKRKKSKPTRSMIRKRLEAKRRHAEKKGQRRGKRVRDQD